MFDLKGNRQILPTQERQIIFIGSSEKIRKELYSWKQELRKKPDFLEGVQVRGLAILPEWMDSTFARPVVLFYVQSQLPEHLHNSTYVLFANPEKARRLFALPANTDDELHLFYLNSSGHILVYTYGAPTHRKMDALDSFSQLHSN